MAFSGYLIKLGGSSGSELPLKYMKYESYKVTPNQRQDLDSTVDTLGYLHRNALSHTRSKIEFNTPIMRNSDIEAMLTLIKSSWSSTTERKLTLEYYDPETNTYKVGTFYMPDIEYPIREINLNTNVITYNEIRIAFIEY